MSNRPNADLNTWAVRVEGYIEDMEDIDELWVKLIDVAKLQDNQHVKKDFWEFLGINWRQYYERL